MQGYSICGFREEPTDGATKYLRYVFSKFCRTHNRRESKHLLAPERIFLVRLMVC